MRCAMLAACFPPLAEVQWITSLRGVCESVAVLCGDDDDDNDDDHHMSYSVSV